MESPPNFLTKPMWIIPSTYWFSDYTRWYETGGKSGVKPTGDIAMLFQLYNKAKTTINEDARMQIMKKMVNLHVKNIWLIGTIGATPSLVIVKNNLRNVPSTLNAGGTYYALKSVFPEQFFIKQ